MRGSSLAPAPALALALIALLPFTLACPHELDRTISKKDAAPNDGWLDACVRTNGGVEICDGLDNDCNGTADDTFNLNTDPLNCGKCGNVCVTPNATAACVAGACAVGVCSKDLDGNTTHWNTDGNWKTGCNYECKILSGGHEVCNGRDNNCNGVKEEKCKSLVLLYRFGDKGTVGSWPTVRNLASNDAFGKAHGGILKPGIAGTEGVKGEGSDGFALALDGKDDQVVVDPIDYLTVFDCDNLTGWSDYGGLKELSTLDKKQGVSAIKITGKTDKLGRLLYFYGTARDLSNWQNKTTFKLEGYFTFWVFIDNPLHSVPQTLEIGNKNNAQNATWHGIEPHVLGPVKNSFTPGWNLVALPFSAATFNNPKMTDWSNTVFMQIGTNVKNDSGATNHFIFDDFRMEKDLSHRFTLFTIMAWVKPEEAQVRVYVLHKKDDLPGMGTDQTAKQWWFTPWTKKNVYSNKGTLKPGTWTHLAMTYDGAVFTAYLNGKAIGSEKTGFAPGERLRIGGDGATGRFFKGLVDEVAVYNRAMSPAELGRYFKLFSP